MRRLVLPTLALSLAACGGYGEPGSTSAPEPKPMPQGNCDAEPANQFIGQTATAAIGAQIQAATGARIFQWVPVDSAVTMDYRPDRVRVTYDRDMKITAITCG